LKPGGGKLKLGKHKATNKAGKKETLWDSNLKKEKFYTFGAKGGQGEPEASENAKGTNDEQTFLRVARRIEKQSAPFAAVINVVSRIRLELRTQTKTRLKENVGETKQ